MKLFVVLLIVCATVLCVRSQDVKAKARELANVCKDEVDATDADVEAMFKHEQAGSSQAKCLNACVLKKLGLMTADGKMDKDATLTVLKALAQGDETKEKVSAEVVETCAGIDVDADHCEASVQYVGCVHKQAKEKGVALDV